MNLYQHYTCTIASHNQYSAISALAGKQFFSDEFYSTLYPYVGTRYVSIVDLFMSLFPIYEKHGIIKIVTPKDKSQEIVGFSLWIGYNKIRELKEEYDLIFPNIEFNKLIDRLVGDDHTIYLTTICTDTNYERNGIASMQIHEMQDIIANGELPYTKIITDISNKDSVMMYENLGFTLESAGDLAIYMWKYPKMG